MNIKSIALSLFLISIAKFGVAQTPPPGFVPYRATQYGNERSARARRISCSTTASGQPFNPNAHAFAMNGKLHQRFKVWTPGHATVVVECNDTGANHPDLPYGFFRSMYYHGKHNISARSAGSMIIWLKRIRNGKY